MKNCGTCRFMAAARDDRGPLSATEAGKGFASCTRVVHGNFGQGQGEIAAVLDGSGYAARLVVLPTFGCVLWEEK